MLKKSKISLPLALLMLASLAGNAFAVAGEVGSPATDYTLDVLGGGTYTLSEQHGQVVMMFVIGFG